MRAEFATTDRLTDLLTYVAEEVSLGFDHWDDEYVRGPSLYFVIASGVRFDPYADPLGSNTWPVEDARDVRTDLSAVVEAARTVAFERDGAVVVTADGTIQEQMVRIRTLGDRELVNGDYPDWMSAKHLSALEVSDHEEVLATVTLSEESGRVVVFRDGQYRSYERDELGHPWRTADAPAADARAEDVGADHDAAEETDPETDRHSRERWVS